MKSALVWSSLRPPLASLSKTGGWARVKSSPPSWSQAHEARTLTLWFKHSSAGWDSAFGGTFTGALQLASEPMPGTESNDDARFSSKRLYVLFDDEDWDAALRIHNAAVAKLQRPKKGHWLYTMAAYVQDHAMKILEPRADLRHELDYWFLYHDADDVAAWGEFVAARVPRWVDRFGTRSTATTRRRTSTAIADATPGGSAPRKSRRR